MYYSFVSNYLDMKNVYLEMARSFFKYLIQRIWLRAKHKAKGNAAKTFTYSNSILPTSQRYIDPLSVIGDTFTAA